jgi:hypothetical protein
MQFIETLSTSAAEDPDPLVHFAVSSSWHVVAVIAPTPTDEDGVTYHALLDQMRGNDRAPSIKVDRDLADLDSLPRYEAAAMMRTDPELLRQATLDQPIRIDEDDTYEVLLLLDDETGEQWSDEVGAAAAEGGYESAEWDAICPWSSSPCSSPGRRSSTTRAPTSARSPRRRGSRLT